MSPSFAASKRPRCRRDKHDPLQLAAVFSVLLAASAACHASDKVILRPKNSSSQITLPCTIVDFTGTQIKVQMRPNHAIKSYPAAQVLGVRTVYTEPHQRGMQQFAEFQVTDADMSFESALRSEPRVWVRREILALLVRCAMRLGDVTLAGDRFLLLVKSDPTTRDFKNIPLVWTPVVGDQRDGAAARLWMERTDEVAVLMGASQLLGDPLHGALAQRKLRELRKSADERIQALAATQLWRTQMRTSDLGKYRIELWEKTIDGLPPSLRGGPLFVLGHARQTRREHEAAAAAWLWLPLVYDHDHQLAARACVQAADALSRLGQSRQAAALYREVAYRYRDTPFAPEAAQWLDKHSTGNQPPTEKPQ